MDIGIKIFSKDLAKLSSFVDLFSFVELHILKDFDYAKLQEFSVPFNLHVPHDKSGFDPGVKNNLNEAIIQNSLEVADLINAQNIIVHPGINSNLDAKQNMYDFFDTYFDTRMLIENCPNNEFDFLCSDPTEMKEFIKHYNTSFLLDTGHAIIKANKEGILPIKMIRDFQLLNPKGYHVYGCYEGGAPFAHHKHFHDVKDDYKYLSILNPDAFFTLETEWVSKSTRVDYEKNISFLQSFFM
jgi:hypothetical protein